MPKRSRAARSQSANGPDPRAHAFAGSCALEGEVTFASPAAMRSGPAADGTAVMGRSEEAVRDAMSR